MTSYPCNKYEQITPSYRLSVNQIASFFIHGGHFNWKKSMIFGQCGSVARLFAQFYSGTRKLLWEFRQPLLEQLIKLVLLFLSIVLIVF